MTPRLFRRLRGKAPVITLTAAMALAGISIWQAWGIVNHLRSEDQKTSLMFGLAIAAMNDTVPERQTTALLDIVGEIRASGIPLIVTDPTNRVTACANLPFPDDPCGVSPPVPTDPRHAEILAFAFQLDRTNAPRVTPEGWRIHRGSTEIAQNLTLLTVFQLIVLVIAVSTATWGFRVAAHLHRDRLWVAMARESAHQLGTPLMSAAAWIERLRDPDPNTKEIARFLRADVDRLERVAQRFERIGRPARREKVGLGSLAERVVAYFLPRLPRHANRITLSVDAPSAGPMVSGDPILLEWALESLVRNSIDALSGRGGTIRVSVSREGNQCFLRVQDDGPGIGLEVRGSLFEPGITTKSGGWGIGLALAHRIVEDVHGGQLRFEAIDVGASFVAQIPEA